MAENNRETHISFVSAVLMMQFVFVVTIFKRVLCSSLLLFFFPLKSFNRVRKGDRETMGGQVLLNATARY